MSPDYSAGWFDLQLEKDCPGNFQTDISDDKPRYKFLVIHLFSFIVFLCAIGARLPSFV